jgi:serine/threonine protein kinase
MTSRTALPANPFRSPERALPAQTRLDEFEIERALAQSSFGVVYRAYDHALKLHVAIKEYLPDALALRSAETQVVLRARSHAERFDQGLQAFIGEAQTLARCDHPSLLRIVRVLQRHGTAYRVMRYTPGPTLLEHRRQLAAPPDAAAMRGWLDALLGALDALHEEGCVHGAVAPGNILLLHGDRPLLLDFDAVRAALISDRTQSMMAALEPCFEPPEQREAADAAEAAMGPWTDLYSLAATLHFCISGQLPSPPTGPAVAFEPLAEVWQRLRAAQPVLGEAPPWLQVLDSCLTDSAQRRPQSVAQVRSLLDALQAPNAARRSPAPRAAPRLVMLQDEEGAAPLPATEASEALAAPVPPPPPPAPPQPADAAHAKVMADLDQTFAFIAAQANEDAAAPAPAAAAAPEAPAEDSGAARPGLGSRQQLWLLAGVAVLLLLAMAAAVAWMLKAYDAGSLGGASLGNATASPWQPQAPPSTRTTPLELPPPSAGRTEMAQPEPPAPPLKPKPAARAPASPREACGRSAPKKPGPSTNNACGCARTASSRAFRSRRSSAATSSSASRCASLPRRAAVQRP